MATEPSKKLDEQHKHGGGPELAAYVDLGMMSGAVLVRIVYIYSFFFFFFERGRVPKDPELLYSTAVKLHFT
jgi:hypothetical protein